jgi:hypothetical protein
MRKLALIFKGVQGGFYFHPATTIRCLAHGRKQLLVLLLSVYRSFETAIGAPTSAINHNARQRSSPSHPVPR